METKQKRQTKQRRAILDIVKQSCDHPTAEEIFLRVKTEIPSISLGTVYRDLKQLSESGEILRLNVPSGDRFDKTLKLHAHFRCKACSKVFDVGEPEQFAAITDRMEKTDEVKIEESVFLFAGLCKNCNNKTKENCIANR